MKQAQSPRGRLGWNEQEQSVLWEEVRACATAGKPLRAAFESTAQRTGRKANSIRNHYYASLKGREAPQDLAQRRAAPFVPFSEEETDALIREVLKAQGSGQSVRACVLLMAEGDKTLALRLQNKYRSLLKSHEDRVRAAMEELKAAGLPCVDPYRRGRSLPRQARPHRPLTLEGLPELLRRLDGESAKAVLRAMADALQAV